MNALTSTIIFAVLVLYVSKIVEVKAELHKVFLRQIATEEEIQDQVIKGANFSTLGDDDIGRGIRSKLCMEGNKQVEEDYGRKNHLMTLNAPENFSRPPVIHKVLHDNENSTPEYFHGFHCLAIGENSINFVIVAIQKKSGTPVIVATQKASGPPVFSGLDDFNIHVYISQT